MPPIERDDLLPPRPPGMGKGLILAIAAHVLLIVAITFSVNWSSSDPAGVDAELWAAVPQIAAQRAAAIEPEPATPPPPKPEPRPEPKPEPAPEPKVDPKPAPDPQIAIEKEKEKEKARKEKERKDKEEKQRDEQARREKAEKAEQQKREADDRKAEELKLAEKKKQEAARQAQAAQQREAQLKRIMAQAGADNGSPGGQGAVTAGPSANYGGRIKGAVLPNIVYMGDMDGRLTADVEVRQAPDGTVTSARVVKRSGSPGWDEAVERAVLKTAKLPRDIDGKVISPIILSFKND